jgi:hypothetical protein
MRLSTINNMIDKMIEQSELPADRFTSYKTSLCGNQIKRDFNRGLTLEQCQELPHSVQHDSIGAFIYQYGINDGQPV